MNLFALSGLLTGVCCLPVAILVFIKQRKPLRNKIWMLFTLSVAWWGFGCYKMASTANETEAFFWYRIAHIGVTLIPVFVYHFAHLLLNLKKKIILKIVYFISSIFFLANIIDLFNSYYHPENSYYFMIAHMKWVFDSFYMDTPPGPIYTYFVAFFFAILFTIYYYLFQALKKSSGAEKVQIKYFTLATLVGFIGGGTSFLPVFGFNVYPAGNFATVLSPLIITYAIINHRLLDISVAITRASIFFAVYVFVLGLPFAIGYRLHGTALWYIPLILAVILASAGPFIYNYLGYQAENRLLADQKKYQETLLHASEGMLLVKDLNRLLKLIVQLLVRTIGLNYAGIYLQDPEAAKYTLRAKRARVPLSTVNAVDNSSPLIKWFERDRKLLLCEEIEFNAGEDLRTALLPEIRGLGAKLIIPAAVQDNLIGFLVLGDKLSGRMYTKEDLAVFQVLANQAALAIENAMFYEETGKTLTQQFHEHRLRSIGRMGSYMGHQINNRFHAVLIHAERIEHLVIKKLEPTITEQQKDFFDKAKESLGIIAENAKRGGAIIERLKAFSRKETTFNPIELDEIMNATLELLSCKFDISELNMKIEIEKSPLKVYGDLAQLQDVFFNLLDNAHDAQLEKKISQGVYVPETNIKAYMQNEQWHIEISDNGIGMKQEELKQLFLPFFTTKATSEKGTGIGMAVIKMMIENNKGLIRIGSEYGKGTVFYITLPAINQKEQGDA